MRCDAFEDRILSYDGNLLAAGEREEVESHLAVCADCRRLAGQLHDLEAALSRRLPTPKLSPGFADRVRQRIKTEAGSAAPFTSTMAERKHQLQLEYEAGEARLRGRGVPLAPLLRWLSYAVLVAVAGWLLGPVALDGGAAWLEACQWTGSTLTRLLPLGSGPLLLFLLAAALVPPIRRRLTFG